jgi:hypothetical protein
MGAEREFGAFGLDGAFDGGLDHVVVVVQPREVNCEPPILLDLCVMGHEDRPGLVLGRFLARGCFGDDSVGEDFLSQYYTTLPRMFFG